MLERPPAWPHFRHLRDMSALKHALEAHNAEQGYARERMPVLAALIRAGRDDLVRAIGAAGLLRELLLARACNRCLIPPSEIVAVRVLWEDKCCSKPDFGHSCLPKQDQRFPGKLQKARFSRALIEPSSGPPWRAAELGMAPRSREVARQHRG